MSIFQGDQKLGEADHTVPTLPSTSTFILFVPICVDPRKFPPLTLATLCTRQKRHSTYTPIPIYSNYTKGPSLVGVTGPVIPCGIVTLGHENSRMRWDSQQATICCSRRPPGPHMWSPTDLLTDLRDRTVASPATGYTDVPYQHSDKSECECIPNIATPLRRLVGLPFRGRTYGMGEALRMALHDAPSATICVLVAVSMATS